MPKQHFLSSSMEAAKGRVFVLIAVVVVIFVGLFCRLIELQLVRSATYLSKAEENRFHRRRIDPVRGIIFDRYQQPLVLNTQSYFQINDPKALYPKLSPLNRDQALEIMATESADVVKSTQQRLYLYPKALSHVLGYVGEVTAEDLERDDHLSVGQQLGKAGLELIHENELRGLPGQEINETNALGRTQRQVSLSPARQGESLLTTIDPYISEVAVRAVGEQRGSVIVTDADTGQVLALVSSPAFDPNILSRILPDPEQEKIRRQQVSTLFSDPQKLFFDRAVAGAYPPGSIFKLVTALAGLSTQKIDAATQVVDEGRIKVGEFEFGNWYFRQYGRVEGSIGLVRALARSNDIYFYKIAEWTGPNEIATMARALGLGKKVDIGLPAEAKGLVPDPIWKEKVRGEKWFLGNTYHFGIGQGDTLTSPLQVAQLTQAIGHNGTLCKLSLIPTSARDCREIGVSQQHLDLVTEGMIEACSATGTAFPFFPYNAKKLVDGMSTAEKVNAGAVACKTGTAEFGAADERGYRKTHGWFTSIMMLPNMKGEGGAATEVASVTATESATLASANATESASPALGDREKLDEKTLHQLWKKEVSQKGFPTKLAITVMIESDDQNPYKEGSKDAAPIAKKILDWIVQ